MEFLVVAELGEAERFGGIGGLGLAGEDRRQPAIELDQSLGLAYPLSGGIRPVRSLRAQFVAPLEFGEGLGELALLGETSAQVVVGLGVVGLEPQRRAVFGDRLVELPLARPGVAEVVVGLGVVGLEPQRLRGIRRSPRPACPAAQGDAQVVVGLGVVGLEPQRFAVLGDRLVQLPLRPRRASPRLLWASARVGLEPDRCADIRRSPRPASPGSSGRCRGWCGPWRSRA